MLQGKITMEDRLCHLAMKGDVGSFRRYIGEYTKGDPFNCYDSDECTPLYCAATKGHKDMLQYLLDNGADPRLVVGTALKVPVFEKCEYFYGVSFTDKIEMLSMMSRACPEIGKEVNEIIHRIKISNNVEEISPDQVRLKIKAEEQVNSGAVNSNRGSGGGWFSSLLSGLLPSTSPRSSSDETESLLSSGRGSEEESKKNR